MADNDWVGAFRIDFPDPGIDIDPDMLTIKIPSSTRLTGENDMVVWLGKHDVKGVTIEKKSKP